MKNELDDLLRLAAEADGLHRMDYRDPIAAYGAEAVRRLEPWLRDPRIGGFAVRTIHAAALYGALAEARAALQRARPFADPTTRRDIDNAARELHGNSRRQVARSPSGSPESALKELRGLVAEWRKRGCPAQSATEWGQPSWIAEFAQHRERLRQLPAMLDRADVRRVTSEAARGPVEAEFAFLVVKAWGEGGNGYGPNRGRESLDVTKDASTRLLRVAETLRDADALAAYTLLADGGACRIFNFGESFATKYLYFCQPGDKRPRALILDKNISDWLHDHAGFQLAPGWSVSRYEAYLAHMQSWADALGCQPDDVELCIFQSAVPPSSRWKGR